MELHEKGIPHLSGIVRDFKPKTYYDKNLKQHHRVVLVLLVNRNERHYTICVWVVRSVDDVGEQGEGDIHHPFENFCSLYEGLPSFVLIVVHFFDFFWEIRVVVEEEGKDAYAVGVLEIYFVDKEEVLVDIIEDNDL